MCSINRQLGIANVELAREAQLHALVFITSLVLFAGLAFLSSSITQADKGNITVVGAKAESQFPAGIKFTVSAESTDEIDEIGVFFKKIRKFLHKGF